MSDEIRVGRQPQYQPQYQPQQQMPRQDMNMGGGMPPQDPEPESSSKMPWIILGLVVVVIIVLGLVFRNQLFNHNGGSMAASSSGSASTVAGEQASGYQAIFLTNGQVYFGKITGGDTNYVTLDDIFYLQVVQPPLQGNGATSTAQSSTAQPQISLVKLGNELHGPVDEMHISRPQILFYEDMKTDSQVVKAIEAYKASNSATPTPTPSH